VIGHVAALRDMLDIAPPDWPLHTGILQRAYPKSALHFDANCFEDWNGGTIGGRQDLLTLLADVPDEDAFTVCARCVRSRSTPDREARQELGRVTDLYFSVACAAHVSQRQDPSSQRELTRYVTDVLQHAIRFADDNLEHWEDRNPDSPELHSEVRELCSRKWDEGHELVRGLLERNVATSHLDTSPQDALVACPKGDAALRIVWNNSYAADDTLYKLAMLEGPRLGETADWFITAATWPHIQGRTSPLYTFENPGDLGPAAYSTALSLWDGTDPDELPDLIRSAAAAAT
jgi:hypothetical protein